MLCPKDIKPCCDDLCHGSGCLSLGGYPMLDLCQVCGGAFDHEIGEPVTCTCNSYDDDVDDAERAADKGS